MARNKMEGAMCAADPRHGRYLTAAALFRGRMSTKETDLGPSLEFFVVVASFEPRDRTNGPRARKPFYRISM